MNTKTKSNLFLPLICLFLVLPSAIRITSSAAGTIIEPPSNDAAGIELPRPTGTLPVGLTVYHWIDSSRTEPFSSDGEAHREVMVYVWYPAASGKNSSPVRYFAGFSLYEKCAGEDEMKGLLGAAYTSIKNGARPTHAESNPPISSSSKKYPLLLFSPGFGEYSLTYTAILEEMVSHGYVVAAIDHPYDSTCVVLPNGRAIPFAQDRWNAAAKQPDGIMSYFSSRIDVWAADTRFVLDQLVRYNDTPKLKAVFARRLDLQRIGVLGHSVGGMTAFRAAELDDRFRAVMNQDSDYQGRPFMRNSSAQNMKKPFLFMVSSHSFFKHTPPPTEQQLINEKLTRGEFDKLIETLDRNQEEALANMQGGSYRVAVESPGFNHRSFIDTALLKTADDPIATARNLKNLQIIRAYTRAFFDKYLKDAKHTLLDVQTTDPDVSVNTYSRRK